MPASRPQKRPFSYRRDDEVVGEFEVIILGLGPGPEAPQVQPEVTTELRKRTPRQGLP